MGNRTCTMVYSCTNDASNVLRYTDISQHIVDQAIEPYLRREVHEGQARFHKAFTYTVSKHFLHFLHLLEYHNVKITKAALSMCASCSRQISVVEKIVNKCTYHASKGSCIWRARLAVGLI